MVPAVLAAWRIGDRHSPCFDLDHEAIQELQLLCGEHAVCLGQPVGHREVCPHALEFEHRFGYHRSHNVGQRLGRRTHPVHTRVDLDVHGIRRPAAWAAAPKAAIDSAEYRVGVRP